MDKITRIVKKYKQYFLDLYVSSENYVYNYDLDNLEDDKIKYIVLADNPGTTELKEKKYLVGDAGFCFRCIMKHFNIDETEYMVLNKSMYSTSVTKELRDKCDDQIFKENQVMIAKMIKEIMNEVDSVNLMILGLSTIHNSDPYFKEFYKELFITPCNKDRFLLFKHPSRGHLYKQIFNEWKISTENDLVLKGKGFLDKKLKSIYI